MRKLNLAQWSVSLKGMLPEREPSLPTLLAIGNGRIGLRGCVPELSSRRSRGIFLAGFYDELPRPELSPDTFNPFLISWSHLELVRGYRLEASIVNCPDFFDGYFTCGGERFVFDTEREEELFRSLCLQNGELIFELPLRTCSGKKAKLIRRRFASMDKEGCAFEKCAFTAQNFSGEVRYHGGILTDTTNFNISGIYQDTCTEEDYEDIRLYDVLKTHADGCLYTLIRGRVRGAKAAFCSKIKSGAKKQWFQKEETNEEIHEWEMAVGETAAFERFAAFACDTIASIEEFDVETVLHETLALSYEEQLLESKAVWDALWKRSDIVITGDSSAQCGVRHSLYELLIACCRSSDKVSVAAKGLSGEGYRGMVFWDTDIHMLPFFLYTQPQMARNIVSFRYRTLKGAREKAQKYGQKGASYPWETGISGKEECEAFLKLLTHQLHITSDVAYAVYEYLDATMDEEFYMQGGAEVLIETARFWVSKGYEKDGELCIPQSSGPDELHLECDNNAYVCNLAALNLRLASQAIATLQKKQPKRWEEMVKRLGITDDEIVKINWFKDHIKSMKREDGVFEQCEGFFQLEDRIVMETDDEKAPADTQTVKQADVIMLLHLLPGLVNKQELKANWDYYEPRTTHTSSLSYGVHGIVAAKLGLMDKAAYYLDKSLGIDLTGQGDNCQDGAHLAANGMSWSAIVCGIGGLTFSNGKISVAPSLRKGWDSLSFTVCYRGAQLNFCITPDKISIDSDKTSRGEARLIVCGEEITLREGESVCRSY